MNVKIILVLVIAVYDVISRSCGRAIAQTITEPGSNSTRSGQTAIGIGTTWVEFQVPRDLNVPRRWLLEAVPGNSAECGSYWSGHQFDQAGRRVYGAAFDSACSTKQVGWYLYAEVWDKFYVIFNSGFSEWMLAGFNPQYTRLVLLPSGIVGARVRCLDACAYNGKGLSCTTSSEVRVFHRNPDGSTHQLDFSLRGSRDC
jgi:hypothetical protein